MSRSLPVVVICLDNFCEIYSTKRRFQMNQSIIEDVHKGCAVTSLCWSDDTTKLFSADSSGLIVMTHVDFCNVNVSFLVNILKFLRISE